MFGEDEAMLEAQQAAIDANPDYEFYSLNIDAGGMWARRIVHRMIDAEWARTPKARVRRRIAAVAMGTMTGAANAADVAAAAA